MTAARGPLSRRSLLLLCGLLLLAAGLKLDYHRSFAEQEPLARAPYGDSLIYLEQADAHFGPRAEPGAFYKPPLYTLLCHVLDARTPEGAARVRRLQLILGCLVLAMVFLMARSRGGDLAGALAFLGLLAYAPASFHETKLLDTIPSLFLTLLACFLLDRVVRRPAGAGTALCAGLVFGLAALTRSANLGLALLCGLSLWSAGGRRPAALLVLGAALAVLPVAISNSLASGDLIPVNYSEGHTFLVGNNPNCVGIYNLPAGYPDGVRNERRVEFERARAALGRDPTPGEQRDHSYAAGWRYLREHPSALPALLLNKLRFLVSAYPVNDNYSLDRERKRFGWLGWARLPFTLLLLAGLAALLWRPACGGAAVLMPLWVTGLLLLVFYVTERYRLPMVPFLSIAAGVGLADVGREWSRRNEPSEPRRWPLRGLLVPGLLAVYTLTVPLPVSRQALEHSEQTFDLVLDLHAAESLGAAGDWARAGGILARAVADHPGDPGLEQRLLALLHGRTPAQLEQIARAARQAAPLAPRVEALLRLAGAGR